MDYSTMATMHFTTVIFQTQYFFVMKYFYIVVFISQDLSRPVSPQICGLNSIKTRWTKNVIGFIGNALFIKY